MHLDMALFRKILSLLKLAKSPQAMPFDIELLPWEATTLFQRNLQFKVEFQPPVWVKVLS